MKRRDFFKLLGAGALAVAAHSLKSILPEAKPAPALKMIEPLEFKAPILSPELPGYVSYRFKFVNCLPPDTSHLKLRFRRLYAGESFV